jgi:hypothetical protein
LTLDHFAVMSLLCSPILPVDPAVEAETVAILIPLLAALAQFGRVEANMLVHSRIS